MWEVLQDNGSLTLLALAVLFMVGLHAGRGGSGMDHGQPGAKQQPSAGEASDDEAGATNEQPTSRSGPRIRR